MIAAHNRHTIYAIVCAVALTACQRNSADKTTTDSAAESFGAQKSETVAASDYMPAQTAVRTVGSSSTDVPYPIYPNATPYRVGSENSLKVVLFQTSDGFEEVDGFYQRMADDTDMPRLAAMQDYVRYTVAYEDTDPWETSKPGIVIHRFNNNAERAAVGADAEALTNIIISF